MASMRFVKWVQFNRSKIDREVDYNSPVVSRLEKDEVEG